MTVALAFGLLGGDLPPDDARLLQGAAVPRAGSVIIAMHHEQDMRHMGGLRKYMPITFSPAWLGTLALTGMPGFSGFFSKDAIIEAVKESHRFGSGSPTACVLIGVFVTALYSFRLLFMTFHGEGALRWMPMLGHHHTNATTGPRRASRPPRAGPPGPRAARVAVVVTLPLILLAIPSVVIGWLTVRPDAVRRRLRRRHPGHEANDVLKEMGHEFHGPLAIVLHGILAWPFLLALRRRSPLATYVYLFNPALADKAATLFAPLVRLLQNKYWIDDLYEPCSPKAARVGARTVEGRRRGGHRRCADRRLRRPGQRVAATVRRAVRLSLPLRLRHDPGPDPAARRVLLVAR